MKLMCYAPPDWLDVVAVWVEGALSSWVNAILQDVVEGHKPMFRLWAQFKEVMVQWFKPITRVEEVQKQL